MEADERLGCAHRLDQRDDAHDVNDAFEIVGQHVQGHFGADPFERLHLEVGIAHPVFDSPEWMLDGFAPLAHLLPDARRAVAGRPRGHVRVPSG